MSESASILLVEDELSIRRSLRINLEAEGFLVREHATGGSAWQDVGDHGSPDLGIFDVMLPGDMDGVQLCERLRQANYQFPIIFLTARDALSDKLRGFESGGDDYLTKPFDLEELLARVFARLRNSQRRAGLVQLGEWQLDLKASSASCQSTGEVVRFNQRECNILALLVEARGRPVSRDEILDRAWGLGEYPSNRTIDNYIVKFRRIFEADPNNPSLFVTRHGTGYELASTSGAN